MRTDDKTTTPATSNSNKGKSGDKTTTANGSKAKSGDKTTTASKTDAPAADASEPPAVKTDAAPELTAEELHKKRIADAQAEIQKRKEARERKQKEDEELEALLLQGQLPPEKTRNSAAGVMAQHVLNGVSAGVRSIHRSIEEVESSITPETPATPEKTAAIVFLKGFRKERMDLWNSKYDERIGSGSDMTHVLPLGLTVDDKGNVIAVEKPKTERKPRGKGKAAGAAT
jgi:hypothetical protein